jgi:adenosylcobinamide kinase/adenosylcobinamide-phosphate guanylyltransferase
MGKVILITGGCRSGKSGHGQELAESLPGPHTYLATCPPIDTEMRDRISRHQADRAGRGWQTVEETVKIADALQALPKGTVLVDCLTLWINNLMFDAEENRDEIHEDDVAQIAASVLAAAHAREGTTIFVTNEVGMGIIPANAVVRKYRDLSGRCNQVIGAGAEDVIMMVSGIPLALKSGNGEG